MTRLYPFTAWLMGPTSSGKTTISEAVMKAIIKDKINIIHYDGDEIRNLFGKDFGFSEENRSIVIKTLVYLASKANASGISVIVSALTGHLSARKFIKSNIINLKTIFVNCPIKVCAARDPKGLYAKAKNKEIDTLIGFNSKYIPPSNPDLVLNTNKFTIEENVNQLIDFLKL